MPLSYRQLPNRFPPRGSPTSNGSQLRPSVLLGPPVRAPSVLLSPDQAGSVPAAARRDWRCFDHECVAIEGIVADLIRAHPIWVPAAEHGMRDGSRALIHDVGSVVSQVPEERGADLLVRGTPRAASESGYTLPHQVTCDVSGRSIYQQALRRFPIGQLFFPVRPPHCAGNESVCPYDAQGCLRLGA